MKNRLFEIVISILTTSAIVHYLYLIRGDYPFFFIATIIIISQMYLVFSLFIDND